MNQDSITTLILNINAPYTIGQEISEGISWDSLTKQQRRNNKATEISGLPVEIKLWWKLAIIRTYYVHDMSGWSGFGQTVISQDKNKIPCSYHVHTYQQIWGNTQEPSTR